jgi:transposase
LNRFLLAILFPSVTLSRVRPHPCGTAPLALRRPGLGPDLRKTLSQIEAIQNLSVPHPLEKKAASGTLLINPITKELLMNTETTLTHQYTRFEPSLYLAFELSQKQWKLGFTVGIAQRPRLRNITARDLQALQHEIQLAKKRFGLPADAPVLSCYEAGRDGFWIHRYLETYGIQNQIVDSASIEVNRRARRRKTDKLDVNKLLAMLIRYHSGEPKVWRVVHVPSRQAEDARHLHRELMTLKSERTRHTNRIKGLLTCQGVSVSVKPDFLDRLESIRLWDGSYLPEALRMRLRREYQRWLFVNQQIDQLTAYREELLKISQQPSVAQVRQLMGLKGIGINSAWLFVMEFFGWRDFRNRREVGACAGLTNAPYQSGDTSKDQGIEKAGNRFIRAMAIEIAWSWLRNQPESKLSRWYQRRFGHGGKRQRKIGIVALARKLLIALWRYLETGTLPEGALLKAS